MSKILFLLAVTFSAQAEPLYYCLAPPTPCQTMSLMTSWQYTKGHLVVNGVDYGLSVGSKYTVPNSIVVPNSIFYNGFEVQ